MKTVMVTGAGGYIGGVLVRKLLARGYEVIALDRFFFGHEVFKDIGPDDGKRLHPNRSDIRLSDADTFDRIWAVIDLASLSNDPAGDINEKLTYSINHEARARNAGYAKQAGVERYILASSCSVYGGGQGGALTEESELRPISTYAKASAAAERDILPLADKDFCATAIRQATVFGLAPRMRFDLVVNLMTLTAVQTGKILIMGGGQQWRPLVHVQDTTDFFIHILEAREADVSGQVFNIGQGNYQIHNLAYIVREALPFHVALETIPEDRDARDYNVSFDKAERVLGFKAHREPDYGVKEIYAALKAGTVEIGARTQTVKWYRHLMEAERLVREIAMSGKML
jgi:nucleoside-diphosphate-sugar epimerase